MVQQTCGAGPMPDLDRRNGLLAAPYAIEPVSVLVLTLIEMNFVRADHGVEDFRIARYQGFEIRLFGAGIGRRHHFIARYKDPALSPVELDSVPVIARDGHGNAVRVYGLSLEFAVHIP